MQQTRPKVSQICCCGSLPVLALRQNSASYSTTPTLRGRCHAAACLQKLLSPGEHVRSFGQLGRHSALQHGSTFVRSGTNRRVEVSQWDDSRRTRSRSLAAPGPPRQQTFTTRAIGNPLPLVTRQPTSSTLNVEPKLPQFGWGIVLTRSRNH